MYISASTYNERSDTKHLIIDLFFPISRKSVEGEDGTSYTSEKKKSVGPSS